MRRISSVFLLRKKDDDRHPKRSWKSWLRRRPEHVPTDDDADLITTPTTLPLDSLIPFTRQSLLVPPSLPPFAPDSPFPRSVSDPGVLPRSRSLRIHVLKSAILHRYENSKHNEQPPTLSDFPNISRPPVSYPSNPGIRRWLSRPCFEDRYVVYTPVESNIACSQVSASLPVAAIEYSDYLEIMAHHPATPIAVDPLPLPRMIEHLPPPSLSVEADPPPPMTAPTTVKRVVRFAADDGQDDDDDDDGVPLHLIRQKKLREQKAKFVKQERLRRAQEESFNRRQREKEALEKERERAMLEAERAKTEKERRQKEQALLTEEVVKTRLRRELGRAGGVPALVMRDRENGLNLGLVSSSTPAAGERNKTRLSTSSSTASLRGVQASTLSGNPRRDSSVDPPLLQSQHHQAASDSSPASSRRSSILAPTINTPSPLYRSHFNSRPPSSYSSSSESIGKRNSLLPLMGSPAMGTVSPMAMQMNMVSMPTYAVPQPIIMTYPPFASSNPNISSNPSQAIPPFVPVNSFIDYNNFMPNDIDMRMPLLPPTAPFMKQPSYERRKTSEKEAGERNSRPASLRSSPGSKRDSNGSNSEWMASVPRERQSSSMRTGKLSAVGTGPGTRKPTLGQGLTQQRSSSGPAVSSSTNAIRRQGQSMRASTMPTPPPVSSPWTGVPTTYQRQQQAQLAMLNGSSKSGTGGQSVSGTSSSTVKKRGLIKSGIGIGKAKNKPSMNSNQERSQAVTW